MITPILSSQPNSTSLSTPESQEPVVVQEHNDLFTLLHGAISVSMDQLEASQKTLLEQKSKEKKKELHDKITIAVKQQAGIEFCTEEQDDQDLTEYKSTVLATLEECFRSIQNQLSDSPNTNNGFQFLNGLSQQMVALSQHMAELEAKDIERVEQNRTLEEENSALKEEIKSIQSSEIEKIDRATSTIIPQKYGTYLGQIVSPSKGNNFLLSTDGKWIVAAHESKAGENFLFNTTSLELEGRFAFGEQEKLPIIKNYLAQHYYVSFISQDGKYFVVSSIEGSIVWELSSSKEPSLIVASPEIHNGSLFKAISSDGHWLVYEAMEKNKLNLVKRAESNQVARTLQSSEKQLPPIFLLNNKWIASAGDSAVYLSALENNNEIEIKLESDEQKIIGLAASADGKLLVVRYAYSVNGKECCRVRLWSIDEVIENAKRPYFDFGDEHGFIRAITISENGKWLAYADSTLEECRVLNIGSDKSKLIAIIPFKSLNEKLPYINHIAWQQAATDPTLIVQCEGNIWNIAISKFYMSTQPDFIA